jgi:hypothetical protein
VSTSTDVHQGSLVKSQLLYQLSYAGASVIVFAESSSACRRSHGRPPALLSKLLSNLGAAKIANSWTSRTSTPVNCPGFDGGSGVS